MFADAWERAARYTFRVVSCRRYPDGSLAAHGATFSMLDSTGWVVTAAHLFDESRRTEPGPELVERWWGADGTAATEVHIYDDVDLALCRLEPCPLAVGRPRFRRPESQRLGTSVLTLGYPSAEFTLRFENGRFDFEGGTYGLYGVEGMLTRIVEEGESDRGYPRRYLETSAATRIGQSGGPTVDASGAVLAVQLRTHHEALGYAARVHVGTRVIREHQVSNTSIGVQTSTLQALFRRHDIDVDWVP